MNNNLLLSLTESIPVSYTHLDVYKRQLLRFVAKNCHTGWVCQSVWLFITLQPLYLTFRNGVMINEKRKKNIRMCRYL